MKKVILPVIPNIGTISLDQILGAQDMTKRTPLFRAAGYTFMKKWPIHMLCHRVTIFRYTMGNRLKQDDEIDEKIDEFLEQLGDDLDSYRAGAYVYFRHKRDAELFMLRFP